MDSDFEEGESSPVSSSIDPKDTVANEGIDLEETTIATMDENRDTDKVTVVEYDGKDQGVVATEGTQEVDLTSLPPDHPLLQSVQEKLFFRLQEVEHKLELELRERQEGLRQEKANREKTGTDLYYLQNQLVQFQQHYEKLAQQMAEQQSVRTAAEDDLKNASEKQAAYLEQLNGSEKNLLQQKAELAKIHQSLHRLEANHQELDSKMLVTQRVASKTDQELSEAELQKQRQDYLFDSLRRQLAVLEEELELCNYRISIQQGESKNIQETLRDATTEMEAIRFEKRQLIHHWKSALNALERRDIALRSLEKAIHSESDLLATLEMEDRGMQDALRQAVEENERQLELYSKLETEVKYREKQIGKMAQTRESLQQQHSVLTNTLEQLEKDMAKSEARKRSVERDIQKLERTLLRSRTRHQELELEIVKENQRYTGFEKQATGTNRDGLRLKKTIFEQEEVLAKIQNDMLHQEIELENMKVKRAELDEEMAAMDAEIDKENNIVNKSELELKKQFEEIGRKQSEMDFLNRKFDKIMAHHHAQAGEVQGEIGPLEGSIQTLQKSIKDFERESEEIQQVWLKTQNDLVALNGEVDEIGERLMDSKIHVSVLMRKRTWLNNQIDQEEVEIKRLQREMVQCRRDMGKVNRLLSKHDQTQQRLEENSLTLESEFRSRLRKAELDNIRLKDMIENTNGEKQQAMDDLISAEHQVMLWERKIKLVRETHNAMDPNKNGHEIKAMEKEVSHLRQLYDTMTKHQKKIIADMEKEVDRHGELSENAVKIKIGTKSQTGPKILQRKLADLRKLQKSSAENVRQLANEFDALKTYRVNLMTRMDQILVEIKQLNDDVAKVEGEKVERMGERQLNSHTLVFVQHNIKRWEEMKDGKYKMVQNDPTKALEALHNAKLKISKLRDVASSLCDMVDASRRFVVESGVNLILNLN